MNKYFLRFHFLTLVNVRLTQSVLLAKLFRIWTPKESVSSMILKYFEASWDSFSIHLISEKRKKKNESYSVIFGEIASNRNFFARHLATSVFFSKCFSKYTPRVQYIYVFTYICGLL